MTYYGTDLAYIQEAAFGDFASDAATGVVTILREAGVDHGVVVDLGCGAGVLAAGLARVGYDVVGFDVSPKLIEYARRRVASASFHVTSLYRAELPECDAVTAIGEVLSYRSDSARDLDTLFGRVHDALRPGGLFLFDLPELGPSWSARRHFEGKDWALMMDVEDHSKRRFVRRKMTTFRKIGKAYRRQTEVHEVELHRPTEVLRKLEANGFEAKTSQTYGNQKLLEGRVAFTARRKD